MHEVAPLAGPQPGPLPGHRRGDGPALGRPATTHSPHAMDFLRWALAAVRDLAVAVAAACAVLLDAVVGLV